MFSAMPTSSPDQLDGTRISRLFMQDEWQPGLFYHLIGKAVPGRTLFTDEESHIWFLKFVLRFKWYGVFEILAYCLCGNHFHVAIRTRQPEVVRGILLDRFGTLKPYEVAFVDNELDYVTFVQRVFRNSLAGFANRINRKQERTGEQLLIWPTLHGLTDKHNEPGIHCSRSLIGYVAFNYAKHHIARAEEKYRWSSLHSTQFKLVEHDILYGYFGGEEAYHTFMRNYLKRYGVAFHAFDEARFFEALQPRRFDKVNGKWLLEEWRDAELLSAS